MTEITLQDDVALITVCGTPINIETISEIFTEVAKAEIDVDMISETPTPNSNSTLSFTVGANNLAKIIALNSMLHKDNPKRKLLVNNGNTKITINNSLMLGNFGYAAKIFKAVKNANANISMITTSEISISILVPSSDAQRVIDEINKVL
ncbi:MAG: ACT domain-containing protein [Candidatus Fimenecus sp.]